jgi:hypothetical protein
MTPDEKLTQWQAELAAMLHPLDLPRSWSTREVQTYEDRRRTLVRTIGQVHTWTATVAELTPQIDALTKWRDFLIPARQKLGDELLTPADNPRDPVYRARVHALKLSITRIDRGLDLLGEMLPANLPLDDLMREAGYIPRDAVARAHGDAWLGTLPDTERRLRELTQKRDDAQARLDFVLRDEPVPTS